MSGSLGQKVGTAARVQRLIDQYVEILVDHCQDPLDQMRFNQGVIQGLRMAMVAGEEAYSKLGD